MFLVLNIKKRGSVCEAVVALSIIRTDSSSKLIFFISGLLFFPQAAILYSTKERNIEL